MTYNAISVTELNKYIKGKFEDDERLNNILVKGEISNFKHHYTGHMYFTLKDENSLIKCVMFKTNTANLEFVPKDGMKVIILGTVSVFERDGVYQIYCNAMKQDGVGDLYKAYVELKNKLEKEGLFDKKYKKGIPYMPKCIGVLTSNTGAVIRDIIKAKVFFKDLIKCFNKKKSECVYKITSSSGSRKRSSRKNCKSNKFNE